MPKTAGTSFRRMLQANLGMNAVYPSDEDLACRSDGLYPSEDEILAIYPALRRYFVLTGHYFAGFAEDLPIRHRTAVFLRDPIQRSLSILAHYERTTGISPHRLLDDHKFVEGCIRNNQTIVLCGERHRTINARDPQILDKALEKVDTFDFVGLTECFPDSCRVFDAVFGTTVHHDILKENVLRPTGTEYDELVPRILPLVELDRVLYERATARLNLDLSRFQVTTTNVRQAA